jgi:hypothetical protein
MKTLRLVLLIPLVFGSAIASEEMKMPDVSMFLQNFDAPFVSKSLAERLAVVIIEEKYKAKFFVISAPAQVADEGKVWSITFENSIHVDDRDSPLPTSNGVPVPKRLTVKLRKSNAEVISIG